MNTRQNKRIWEYIESDRNNELHENLDEVEPPNKKQKLNSIPKLIDGKYFELVKRDDTIIEAKCTTCGKIRKGDIRSTGNFMMHYKSSHPTLVNDVELHKKQKNGHIVKQTTLTAKLSNENVRQRSIYYT